MFQKGTVREMLQSGCIVGRAVESPRDVVVQLDVPVEALVQGLEPKQGFDWFD
jgi:hypothetical protein